MGKKRIGLLVLGVGSNFGGAERLFADLFDSYSDRPGSNFQLFLITDRQSLTNYKRSNLLKKVNNILLLPVWNNRFKKYLEFISFFFTLLIFRIRIIHVPVYGVQHFYNLKYLSKLKFLIPVKIVINIEDCRIVHAYESHSYDFSQELKRKYDLLFSKVKIDAIYTWYELFKAKFRKNKIIASLPLIESADYCFADLKRFNPHVQKKNQIVYAARLEPQKQPILFLDAIRMLYMQLPKLFNDWKVIFVGYGSLEKQVKEYINANNLLPVITFHQTTDLSLIYNESKCFVSTQDFENFTSLSMLEAMAAGNTIIARNVGQTNYFVQDRVNGVLAEDSTPESLAQALRFYMEHSELHDAMMKESVRLATQVHTVENFIKDIESFWGKVLGYK
jgi:glycosyltransferase involved in cell wall biosynthesis